MTALLKYGFYWFCTNCRHGHRLSQLKILSNSSSQTYPTSSLPIYNNHDCGPQFVGIHSPAPAPHLSQQPMYSTPSPHTPSPNPSSQTVPQSPPSHPLFLPSLLSLLAYSLLSLNAHNPSLP